LTGLDIHRYICRVFAAAASLPLPYWPLLAGTLLGYVLLTQVVKTWLFRMGWVSE
jgi:hypothetical protein